MSKWSSSEEQNSEALKSKIKFQIEREERQEDEGMIEEYKKDNSKDKLLNRMSVFSKNIIFTFVLWEIVSIFIFFRRIVQIPQLAYYSKILDL